MRIKTRQPLGFTLIELLITIAIVAIVTSVAVPTFTKTIKNNRLSSKATDLHLAIVSARQYAISRNITTFICHSNNADSATPACDGGTSSGWNTGYLIYSAPPRTLVTGLRDFTTGDELLQQVQLTGNNGVSVIGTNVGDHLGFKSNGLLLVSNNSVSFKICDDRTGEQGKIINLSTSGSTNTLDAPSTNSCS